MEIGENCVIHPSVKFGENVKVGNNCVIMEGCEIGDETVVEHFVLLKKGTKIGNNCYVDSYVRSSGDNLIGDNVTLRFGSTIAREVIIKNNAFISPNVMTIYSTHEGKKMPGTIIGERAHVGTAAVIGPSINIGDDVVIGAMAFVSKHCEEPGIYLGVPAKKREKK